MCEWKRTGWRVDWILFTLKMQVVLKYDSDCEIAIAWNTSPILVSLVKDSDTLLVTLEGASREDNRLLKKHRVNHSQPLFCRQSTGCHFWWSLVFSCFHREERWKCAWDSLHPSTLNYCRFCHHSCHPFYDWCSCPVPSQRLYVLLLTSWHQKFPSQMQN